QLDGVLELAQHLLGELAAVDEILVDALLDEQVLALEQLELLAAAEDAALAQLIDLAADGLLLGAVALLELRGDALAEHALAAHLGDALAGSPLGGEQRLVAHEQVRHA